MPGAIDGINIADKSQHNGYEDEETRRALEGDDDDGDGDAVALTPKPPPLPVLVVTLPELPVGAVTELEIVAATRTAVECLDIGNHSYHNRNVPSWSTQLSTPQLYSTTTGWDTGHDFAPCDDEATAISPSAVQVHSYVRSLGASGEASFGFVTASAGVNNINNNNSKSIDVNMDVCWVLRRMLEALRHAHLDARHVLQLRLYYSVTVILDADDSNAQFLHSALQAAMGTVFDETCWPASTVIPVHGLDVVWLGDSAPAASALDSNNNYNDTRPVLALQAMALDPVHLEQSIWIRHGRRY